MITLRGIESKDIAPLADTLPKGFQNTTRETWLQRFENWWTLNPAFTSGFPRGWVLEDEAKIVGFIGNIPVQFVIHGETRIAAASASWYVDPSVRGMTSIRLFKEYLNQSDVALFLFWNDNPDLLKVVSKLGFKEYPSQSHPSGYPSEYLFMIDRIQYARQHILPLIRLDNFQRGDINNYYGFPRPLKNIGFLAYSSVSQWPANEIGDRSDGMYTSSLCTYCDDSFTRLWDPHLESFDVAMSRDASTLNWLYFTAGRRYNRTVIQCRRSSDDSLAGYMVFDFPPGNASEGGLMKLMDMRIMNNDPQVLASLISHAIEVGKENNAPVVRLWADSPDTDMFLRKKFRVKRPAKMFSLIKLSETLERDLPDPTIYSCMMNPPRGIDH